MGIFDLFAPTSKKVEEMTQAFIGMYTFQRINDEQRKAIIISICTMISDNSGLPLDKAQVKFNSSPAIVQGAFFVNGMINLRISPGVHGVQWNYIHNPFALATYLRSDEALATAMSNIRQYGIDPMEFTKSRQTIED